MKITVLLAIISLGLSVNASSHEGKTDNSGGHNCQRKAAEQGLCSEYHYHKPKRRNYGHVAKVGHQESKRIIEREEKPD